MEMDSWIFGEGSSTLRDTPSRRDGISQELENTQRAKTVVFVEELGKGLKCNRLVVSTACVLFHRFYVYQSFRQHNRFIVAATCLFLGAKVEEEHKRIEYVVREFLRIKRMNGEAIPESEEKELKNKILLVERILLSTLCFELQVQHPYKECFQKIKLIRNYIAESHRDELNQVAINFANDSMRSTLCLQYEPKYIAMATVFLAAIQMSIKPISPRKEPEKSWFELLESDIPEMVLKSICTQLLDVYDAPGSSGSHHEKREKALVLKSSLDVLGVTSPTTTVTPLLHHPSPTATTQQASSSSGSSADVGGAASSSSSCSSSSTKANPSAATAAETVASSSNNNNSSSNNNNNTVEMAADELDYPYEEAVAVRTVKTTFHTRDGGASSSSSSSSSNSSSSMRAPASAPSSSPFPPPPPPSDSPFVSSSSSSQADGSMVPPTPPPPPPSDTPVLFGGQGDWSKEGDIPPPPATPVPPPPSATPNNAFGQGAVLGEAEVKEDREMDEEGHSAKRAKLE